MILQPGNYDVYVHAFVQSRIRIAAGLTVPKSQTLTIAPSRLLSGVVVKDLGIPGVKVGTIEAVKKGSPHHRSNIVQQVSRLNEVMLVPPAVAIDVYLTPWLAEPMQLQSVTTKAGELTVIGGEEDAKAQTPPRETAADRNAAIGTGPTIAPTAMSKDEEDDRNFKIEDTEWAKEPAADVSELLRRFQAGPNSESIAAAQLLGALGDKAKAAAPTLAKMVAFQKATKTELMMANFGFAGGPTADPVRIAAAKALYKIDRATAIEAIESATQCSHPGVRRWATLTLDGVHGRKPAPAKKVSVPSGKFKVPSGEFKK